MSSEKPETALAMAGDIFAKFGNGEEEFANPVLTGEIFADGDDDGEEFTYQVVRELVKSSSMQTSSQNQEHFDVTVHFTDYQEVVVHDVEERTGIGDV